MYKRQDVIRNVHSLKNIFEVRVLLVSSKKEMNKFQIFAAQDIRNLHYVYIFSQDVVYTDAVSYTHLDVYKRQMLKYKNDSRKKKSFVIRS